MSPRYNRKNMHSPYFDKKPYGHDNPKAKGPEWESAIEAFFEHLWSKIRFWKK